MESISVLKKQNVIYQIAAYFSLSFTVISTLLTIILEYWKLTEIQNPKLSGYGSCEI